MSIHPDGKPCSFLGRLLDLNDPAARFVNALFNELYHLVDGGTLWGRPLTKEETQVGKSVTKCMKLWSISVDIYPALIGRQVKVILPTNTAG